MKLLIVLAATFLILNIGIWGLYFFGKDVIKIPEIPAVPKELSFEKPSTRISLDLPIPEGEKAVLVKKGKTRGLDGMETMVVAEELASKTYHLMIFDNQKILIFEDKNTMMPPDKILLQVYEGDIRPSFYLAFSNNLPGYHLKWNGYQYIVPENEKDLM